MTSTTFDSGSDQRNAAAPHTRSNRAGNRMIEETASPPSPQWSIARKPFWWALLATIVLSTAGGMAIYFIHSTTPTTGSGMQAGSRDSSRTRLTGTVTRPSASPAGNPGSAIGGGSQEAQGSTQSLSSAASPGAAQRPGQEHSQPQPPQRAAERGTNAGEIAGAPPPTTAPGATAMPRTAPEASIQWSKDRTQGTGAGTSSQANSPGSASVVAGTQATSKGAPSSAAKGTPGRPSTEGTGSFPPTAIDSGKGGRPANQQAGASTGGAGNAGSMASTASPAAQVPVQVASARPSAAAPFPKLKEAQEKQCAETNFFSRLVCDERVRLRYCRDLWNEHPDCMVTPQQREP